MLIRFSVANFLSFKQPVDLRMIASSERIHPHHVYRTASRSDPKLLRMAAVYGPNAAGKSNLVEALGFLKHLVTSGIAPEKLIDVQRFRLDRRCLQEPAELEVELRVGNTNYSYAIALDPNRIHREELRSITNTSDHLLFSRTTSEDRKVNVQFGRFVKRLARKDQGFLEFVGFGTRPNQLFLRETVERNVADRNVTQFKPVYDWFNRTLNVIRPETKYRAIEVRMHEDKRFSEFVSLVLKSADTGISEVKTQEVPIGEIPHLSDDSIQEMKEQLAGSGGFIFFASNIGDRFAITLKGDELRVLKLIAIHKCQDTDEPIRFDIGEESDGTQRLLDLVPVVYGLTSSSREKVYVVDELDRSLHPHLTKMIIDRHLSEANADTPSQLIVTTHETNLLDLELLRRDEIWFVEKRDDGSTDLYSLSDFQPRYDKEIRRDYLIGRYGAIPYIGGAQFLGLPSSAQHTGESVVEAPSRGE
jgi:hypothetical protein